MDSSDLEGDLIPSLDRRKMYREVTLSIRSGIRDATSETSFLRVRGLQVLLKALQSISKNDTTIGLFHQSQSIPQLQVVPVLFQHTLKQNVEEPIFDIDHILGVEPKKICSPATEKEVAIGLRVLQGCCLLHEESKFFANQYSAVKVIINLLSTRGILEQGACLDVLVSLMLDSPSNQLEFEACRGLDVVAQLIKDDQKDEDIRLKCGEFLLLLIGHVNGREMAPLATIHDDIQQLLGEKCASLIWAASQFGSTLNPDERQIALQIQTRRVLEAIEFY